MKVEYLKKEDKKARFAVKGISFPLANAIRRAMMTYVPSMAVDSITVYENTSPLYEEMIAQRIGLVPLGTDLKTYSLREECKCKGKGCARCQATFILEKSGPGFAYSGDMKARDPKTKPVFDKIPIVKLGEGQKLKMEMTARLGFMTEHAKFQGSLASYKQLSDKDFEFFVESYNNLSAKEIIDIALDALEERAAELEGAFSENKAAKKKTAKKAKKATKKK